MTPNRRSSILVLVTALAVAALVLPTTIGARSSSSVTPEWVPPTPAEGTVFGVAVGSQVTVLLAAQAAGGPAVSVQIRTAETKGRFTAQDGNPARATFSWTPATADIGERRITFTAGIAGIATTSRTIVIKVGPAGSPQPPPPPGQPPPKPIWPKRTVLSDYSKETYKWAFVRRRTVVRRAPSRGARAFSTLRTVTPEYFPNLVQTLRQVKYRNGQTWVQVRLAILPNSSTGWVPRRTLGRYRTVRTRLFVSRSRLRATLYRRGRKVFSAPIGIGQSRWPTPRGDFYTREVLTGYNMPVYGPIAIGISARSPVLTDWPGGGFIGIHGTNQPGILPGRVSHGCIRMRNAHIIRLNRLMPLGTPVQVR